VKLAIAVLVATAPIGDSGLLSDRTSVWWQRQAMATFRLLLVPPSITLCFALGFGELKNADGVEKTIVALMTLAAAVLCWPALARFFAIDAGGQVSGGLGLLIGAASGLGSRFSGMGNTGAGNPLNPEALQRTAGAGSQAGGAATGAARAATGGPAFLPMAATAAVAAVGGFQRGLGRTAAHAGLGGVGESVDPPRLRDRGRSRGGRPSAVGPGASAPPAPAAPAPIPAGDGDGRDPMSGGGAAEEPSPDSEPFIPAAPSASPMAGRPAPRPPTPDLPPDRRLRPPRALPDTGPSGGERQ
jgi:hypothetical protein